MTTQKPEVQTIFTREEVEKLLARQRRFSTKGIRHIHPFTRTLVREHIKKSKLKF